MACGAPSGVCVEQGPGNRYPMIRTSTGWIYVDSGGFEYLLGNDGNGVLAVPDGIDQSVSWMTEPWES